MKRLLGILLLGLGVLSMVAVSAAVQGGGPSPIEVKLTATDEAGEDLLDVSVSIDTEPFAAAATTTAGAPVMTGAAPLPTAAATLPLRWRVAHIVHATSGGALDCETFFFVQNTTGASVDIEVEIFDSTGASTALVSSAVATGALFGLPTSTVPELPQTGTVDFFGYANVHADDPRVLAGAFIDCSPGIWNAPTFGVGQTLAFFQAAVPGIGGRLGGAAVVGQ